MLDLETRDEPPSLSSTLAEVAILSVPTIAGVAAFSELRWIPLAMWVVLTIGILGGVIHQGRTESGRLAIEWPIPDSMVEVGLSFVAYNGVIALGYGIGSVMIPILDQQVLGVLLGVAISYKSLDQINLLVFRVEERSHR